MCVREFQALEIRYGKVSGHIAAHYDWRGLIRLQSRPYTEGWLRCESRESGKGLMTKSPEYNLGLGLYSCSSW